MYPEHMAELRYKVIKYYYDYISYIQEAEKNAMFRKDKYLHFETFF